MSDHNLNIALIGALITTVALLVREWLNGTSLEYELGELRERLEKQSVTFDRMYRERNEAIEISDHAITVITEARNLVHEQRLSARLDFLIRSFVDRRQELANQIELKNEIEKMTGEKK